MKKFIEEFKAFISRGNVLDMAIGVIIATAFGKITSTLVGNVITPLLAFAFNSPNTDALNITLRAADEAAGIEAIVLGLGDLVGAIIDFIIISIIIFSIVKAFNKAKAAAEARKKAEAEAAAAAEPEPEPGPTTEELLGRILEELQKK